MLQTILRVDETARFQQVERTRQLRFCSIADVMKPFSQSNSPVRIEHRNIACFEAVEALAVLRIPTTSKLSALATARMEEPLAEAPTLTLAPWSIKCCTRWVDASP